MTGVAKRLVYLDYLRVIATIFVIGVHTVSLAAAMTAAGSTGFYVLEIFDYVFLSCNLLFVMISGALLLGVKNENPGRFFIKRFSKVAIPLVVYYVMYVVAKEGWMWLTPKYWWVLFLRILMGAPEEAPHFWLVYTILMLYLATPLFRYLVQNIPEEVFAGVIGVVFVVNALKTYLPAFGVQSHLDIIVDSYAGVFLLGFFLSKKHSRRTENLLIIGGAASFILSCILICSIDNYKDYIHQNAPTMMLFTSAIFLMVKRVNWKESRFIRLICKYSFSVLLIHWGVLHFVVKQLLHVNVLGGGIWGGCILMISLTFVISLLCVIVIDNTVVRLIYAILKLPGKGICLLHKKFPRKNV